MASFSLNADPWPSHRPSSGNGNGNDSMSFFNSMRSKIARKGSGSSASSSKRTSSIFSVQTPTTSMPASTPHPQSTPPATRRPSPRAPTEAPPAYTPRATIAPAAAAATSVGTDDTAFNFLSTFDTLFLIDDSGSMAGSSWRTVSSALRAITPICVAHDSDGIDVHFLNASDRVSSTHIKTAEGVESLFARVRPSGGTPTGNRLLQLLRPYVARYRAAPSTTKPLNVIVITDGAANDDVGSVLVSVAAKLDKLDAPPWQVGVQFFQVGNEPGAAEALKELDDDLAEQGGGIRDMVDTVPWREDMTLDADRILKVVLGAVNRRLDRRRVSAEGGARGTAPRRFDPTVPCLI
ncbi:MAG: hypothetical protein M1825_002429 [Sarcosagium campestre]|nr:MAG: hypothetical protein M1825_002429 [Sarcosagium campestre]